MRKDISTLKMKKGTRLSMTEKEWMNQKYKVEVKSYLHILH